MDNLIYDEEGYLIGVKDIYKVNWICISKYKKLSEDFMRKFKHKLYWSWVWEKQKLSEDLIRKFIDKADWLAISRYQKLSENFIIEFMDELYLGYVCEYQNLSDEFMKKLKIEQELIEKIARKRKKLYQKNKLKCISFTNIRMEMIINGMF